MSRIKSTVLIILLISLPIMLVLVGAFFPSNLSIEGIRIFKEQGIADKMIKGENLTKEEIAFLEQGEGRFIISRISGIKWKDVEKARALYERLADMNIKNQAVYIDLARQYKNQGVYDKAIEMYKKAIDLDPEYKKYTTRECLTDISAINHKIKENQKTIEICSEALEKYPKNIYIRFTLGNVYFVENDPSRAIEEYKKIKDYDPAHKDDYTKKACINLARAYRVAGRYSESIKEYEELSTDKVYLDAEALQWYAQSYLLTKDYDKAIEIAKRGLLRANNYDTRKAGLYKILAASYLEKKNLEEGLKYLRLTAEADPKDEKIKEILRRVEIDKKWNDTSGVFPAPIERKSQSKEELSRASILMNEKKYEEAIKILQDVLKHPKYSEDDKYNANLAIGDAYYHQGKHKESIGYYDDANRMKPKRKEPYSGLGAVYNELRDYEKCIFSYKKALELDPDDAEINVDLAAVYMKQKDYKMAEIHYKKAAETLKAKGDKNELEKVQYCIQAVKEKMQAARAEEK